ncbi:DUF3426 domain-containing protein [Diaphorobacter sp.]|uniref:DUF3426 domain-containing protein n=1 Tax=Diaphorobacter sp. TaxID=1934310 RepID=UPI00258CC86A|nr:DUF3426 domain-containing protein [Diaphorobacter sp.]
MSQITRCPSCATMFKVVADQLRISDGWVRCGQCQQVFDASAHLQPPLPPVLANDAAPVPHSHGNSGAGELPGTPVETKATAPAPSVLAAPVSPIGQDMPGPVSDPELEPEPEPEPESKRSPAGYELPAPRLEEYDPASPDSPMAEVESGAWEAPEGQDGPVEAALSNAHPDPLPTAPALSDEGIPDVQSPPRADGEVAPWQPDRVRASEVQEEESLAEAPAAELSFIRAARRKAFWRKTPVRVGLSLLAWVLLCGLLLQVAVSKRNVMAAQWPASRSHLEALCAPLQCRVEPYRQISAVVVDASTFQKIRGDQYQFSLTLKNRSQTAVETPAIELTLTDAQDQPVLRRVLTPKDLVAPAELSALGDWNFSASLQVSLGATRITGYRVLAFYP